MVKSGELPSYFGLSHSSAGSSIPYLWVPSLSSTLKPAFPVGEVRSRSSGNTTQTRKIIRILEYPRPTTVLARDLLSRDQSLEPPYDVFGWTKRSWKTTQTKDEDDDMEIGEHQPKHRIHTRFIFARLLSCSTSATVFLSPTELETPRSHISRSTRKHYQEGIV